MTVNNSTTPATSVVGVDLSAKQADHNQTSATSTATSSERLAVTIRSMRDDDRPVMAQIMQDTFGEVDKNRQWTLEFFNETIEKASLIGFVAEHNGEIVAFMLYHVWGGALYLCEMATKLAWRSRGIGSQLMRFLLDLCSSENKEGLWLQVFSTNLRAQAFYKAHGFEIFGKVPNMYGPGDGMDGNIMICGECFCEDVHSRPAVYKELWKCE